MIDVKIVGKHADLIENGDIELYYKDWLRDVVKTLMVEAYEAGRLNRYPYDKELEKTGINGWKELYDNCNRRIDVMLDIGRLAVPDPKEMKGETK